MEIQSEERTWSFGPSGSRDNSNWMSGGSNQSNKNVKNTKKVDAKLIKAEFNDKFPTIPQVSDIDGGFSKTVHQKAERVGRDEAIKAYSSGIGNKIIAVYWTDRGNPSGAEYHWITDNGLIIITNDQKNGGKEIVTKLIARPGQLLRYQNNCVYGDPKYYLKDTLVDAIQVYPRSSTWTCPRNVINLARLHQQLGLNYMEESTNKWVELS